MKKRIISYTDAINEALVSEMKKNKKILSFGLGINDPKKIFNSTKNLEKLFGKNRVFDVPNSENSLLGIGIGLAISGMPCVMTHQRLDFFLLAFDQLINSASKWHYMFGGNSSVPIVIRLIIGRGWGQGPTHSQNLQAVFSHFPGLKIVMPTNPYDAKGLLISSIRDPNPIIFLEHRWLHNTTGHVPKKSYAIKIGKSKKINNGKDLTIVSTSYFTIEMKKLVDILSDQVSIDFIDLRSIKPIDKNAIINSVKKTKKALVLDTGFKTNSISSEIISIINEKCFKYLEKKIERLTVPDCPEPASFGLTKFYYPNPKDIINRIERLVNKKFHKEKITNILKIQNSKKHDVPGNWFKGPF